MKRRHNRLGTMASAVIFAVAAVLLASQPAIASGPAWISQSGWNVSTPKYARPTLGDLDGDNLTDMLVGNLNGTVVAYKNTGTASAPIWSSAPAGWNISTPCNDGVGAASFSAPALVDLNGDGLLDLFIGTRERNCVYQNTGTTSAPIWTRKTAWDLSGLETNRFYTPSFADLDGDGKVDLMLGNVLSDLRAFRNTTTDITTGPVWTRNTAWDIPYVVTDKPAPALGDLDGDGLIDLLIGTSYGTVIAYKNTGTTASPVWTSAGGWYLLDPFPAISADDATPALGNLDADNKLDLMYGDHEGGVYAYQQNPAGLPPPVYASGSPTYPGTTTAVETFDSFACPGAWKLAGVGPNSSYTRNCGNGWTVFAEDAVDTKQASPTAGPIGSQNVVTIDSTVNGPSAATGTALGAAEIYTTPQAARGVLWLMKTFPVTPGVPVKKIQADFRFRAIGAGATEQYYGMVVFDGAVTNPSGLTDKGVPLRSDVLASNISLDLCNWCAWRTVTLNQQVEPRSQYITVAFRVEDKLLDQTSWLEVDNFTVDGVNNPAASSIPSGDLALLWKQDIKASGNNNFAAVKDLKVDGSGNIYAVANIYNGTNYDIVTTRTDPAGNQVWQKSYNGGDSDQATALVLDTSGNVVVTGRSYNAGTDDDYVVIKYDSSGTQMWAYTYDNGNRIDDPVGLVVDASGNSYVTGSSCLNAIECKFATIKLNSAGILQWGMQYDGGVSPSNNRPVGIGVDAGGNVYVSGTVSGQPDEIVTVKYDSSGTLVRENVYGGGINNRAVAMKTDSAGNVYITGYSFNGGSPAILTIKYGSGVVNGGAADWAQFYNYIPEALPTAMTIDATGNIYITGVVGDSIDHNFITMRYMSDGTLAWVQFFGNPGEDDRSTNIAVDVGGNVWVAGIMGRVVGNSDFVLIKYDTAGIARNAVTFDGYTVKDEPHAIDLGVDTGGDTIPYVAGFSADLDGVNHMVTLRYLKALPDLTPTTVTGPASAVVGNSISVSSTVLNISDAANKVYLDSGNFTVGLYLAPKVGGVADLNNLTFLGSRTIVNLSPGQSDTASTSVTIPATVAEGTYALVAVADSADAVTEADETNNKLASVASIQITGIKPDLVVTSVTGPLSVTHGVPFDVSTTVMNQVSTAIPGTTTFRVGIYASTDSTVTTADDLIGSYSVTTGLAGFASVSTVTSVSIPSAGNYYVAAIADDLGDVDEANESNNTAPLLNGTSASTLLSTKNDFVAGLPGSSVAVMSAPGGAARVQLASSVAWTLDSSMDVPAVGAGAKPALGDLNGDGLLDVMVGENSGNVTGYMNTGTATTLAWTSAPTTWNLTTACGQNIVSPSLADLNGDGLLDLVVGTIDKICMFQNTGTPSAPAWTRNTSWEWSMTTTQRWAVATADLDNDGLIDILRGSISFGVQAFRNTGTASAPVFTYQPSWNVPGTTSLNSSNPVLVDIDGDGDFDLMVGDKNGAVHAYENTGSLTAPTWTANAAWDIADPNASTNNYAGPAVGDLNGDGRIDLLYGDDSGATFGYGNSGSFSSPGTYTSKVVDAGSHGGFSTLTYNAIVPSGTTLTVDVRAGNNPDPNLGTWTSWLTSVPTGGDISSLGSYQYVQYKFNLATTNAAVTPAIYYVQALTNPPANLPVVASVVVGDSGGGGGELNPLDLMFLCILALFSWGRRRYVIRQ